MPKITDRSKFIEAARTEYGNINSITRQQVLDVCASQNLDYPNWLVNDKQYRIARGVYSIASFGTA